jgi:hypothetical protein
MTPEEANLEALKLANSHGREIAEIVRRATTFRDFILGAATQEEPPKAKRKAGTP